MAFLSWEGPNGPWDGMWLYADTNDVRADHNNADTDWKHCGKALVEQMRNLCLEKFCCGDNNDGTKDVRLATCSNGKKEQEWDLRKVGNYYQIKNLDENCCLDVYAGDPTPDQMDVDCESCDSSNTDQLWTKY